MPVDPPNVRFDYDFENLKPLNSFVLRYLGLQQCRACSIHCFANNMYAVVIRYNLQLTNTCKRNQILTSVNQNTDNSSVVPFEFYGHIFNVNFDQNKELDRLFTNARYGSDSCLSFPSTRGYNCPKVWLNHTELAYMRSVHTRLYYYQENTSGSYVCLDNYNINNDSTSNSYNVCLLFMGVLFCESANMIAYSLRY